MKLQDVFMKKFPRASHPPAAFCPFPDSLLVLIIACLIYKTLLPYNVYEFFLFVNYFFVTTMRLISATHFLMKTKIISCNGADAVFFQNFNKPLRICHTEDHTGLPILLSENRIHIFHINPGGGNHPQHLT